MKNLLRCFAALILLLFAGSFFPHASGAEETLTDNAGSVEERRILMSLQKERANLSKQQELLEAKNLELKTLQAEVDKKLQELKKLREETQELLSEKEVIENAKLRSLGKMYEKMDPGKAATILITLETKLAVDILGNMKQKSAGKILNSMDGEKAAKISIAFSKITGN